MTSSNAVADTDAAELERVLTAAYGSTARLAASSPTERAGWLTAVADTLDAASNRLLPLAAQESHLTEARLASELARTTFQLRLFADTLREGSFLQATIDHPDPAWPMGPRPDLRRTLRPIGPVAVYAASNFPFAFSVAGGDTAAAIAAGAPVVAKGNPGHPRLSELTAELVGRALSNAGAPDGAFALVLGFEIGRALVQDPRIAAASFTGSLAGGRALYDLAVNRDHPIPFYGELGSVNPVFVTPAVAAARAEEIGAGFLASVSLGVGQFCTKPGFLFVPDSSTIPAIVGRLCADYPPAPMLNEHISEGYIEGLRRLAGHPAVRVLAGDLADGSQQAPTVLLTSTAELLADPRDLMVECFGPTAIIVTYANEGELLAAAGAFDGQLTASVQGEEEDAAGRSLVELLTPVVGRLLWNGWPTGVSVTYAMQHGGPYPATTAAGFTSVGTTSIERFLRPVSYQGVPNDLLPPEVRDDNPWQIPQRVDGVRRPPS
jgi:NADP-dependent aldehyde dehydrogenase